MKLHLGCGNISLDNYINIDTRYQPGVDRVDNIGILKRFEPESVGEIYCAHALDNFSRWDYSRVLARWYELLKPGACLKLSVIDFHTVVELYVKGASMSELIGCLVAAQDYESNVRHMHWTFVSLDKDLKAAGFSSVTRVFKGFQEDDCSSAKIRDTLISLNVVAKK